MQKNLTLSLPFREIFPDSLIRDAVARQLGLDPDRIQGVETLRRSLDGRHRPPQTVLQLNVFVDEPFLTRHRARFRGRNVVAASRSVVIVGCGPAGLFAALQLVEAGIKPILLERGKDVRMRRRDLAQLNRQGQVNPESNYCFGEGGAGTYSDGKLYTRSTKRGDVARILELLHEFGAPESILYEAHPHIGTNRLPQIIVAIREKLLECGAEVHFEKKLVDWSLRGGSIYEAVCADGDRLQADALILATGHSARDIFQLMDRKGLEISAKPFAIGVRVEHPQELIDQIQYGQFQIGLPPASYSLVGQVEGRGVFSFCMCPGGIIAPAATAPGEIVVNGWSPSKRNNPFANSGIVVSVDEQDAKPLGFQGAFSGMRLQQWVEQKAFEAGGGLLVAPALRLTDFVQGKVSTQLPACSYLPGIRPFPLHEVLPGPVHDRLQKAFLQFGKKMKGYLTDQAVVVATESRTSSPVRIPRDSVALHHPQLPNLYPCGEGAGYAGGIVSAAMDGTRVALQIASCWAEAR